MAIPYLPPEILTNILLRLDLKTLSSVRLVKKCWLQFISSPDFARAHLKSSKEDHGFIVFATSDFTPVLGKFLIASLLRKSYSIKLVNSDHPKMRRDVRLVGSCNGLVCIITRYIITNVLLWNPCTGELKELSPLDVENCKVPDYTYGFGYDASNDDYKVVVLHYFGDDGDKNCRHYEVKVISLKRNHWKTSVRYFKGKVFGLGKISSGKMHWLANADFDYHWRKDIISFDLGSEVFGIVEQPSYGNGRFEMALNVLEGCICLLVSDHKETYADLWVMKEYGVKESWTKVVRISCIYVLRKYYRLSPCSMLPNGEILFDTSESFAVYNPKDDSFRFTGIVKNSRCKPVIYVPSLVSPLGYWKAMDEESKDGTTSEMELF